MPKVTRTDHPPTDWYVARTTLSNGKQHVLVSSVDNEIARETLAFLVDDEGEVLNDEHRPVAGILHHLDHETVVEEVTELLGRDNHVIEPLPYTDENALTALADMFRVVTGRTRRN